MVNLKDIRSHFAKGVLLFLMIMMGACQPSPIDSLAETLTPEVEEVMPEIVSGSDGASSGGAQSSGEESDGGSSQNGQMNGRLPGGDDQYGGDLCATVNEDGPCSNPYLPVIEGLRVQFSSADGEITQTIDEVGDGGFTVTQVMPDGSSFPMEWECTPEGLKGFTDQDLLSDLLADFGGAYSSIEIDGIALPADISVGDSWKMSVRIIVGVTQGGADSRNIIDLDFDFAAVDEEVVVVPAGTFTALRVDYSSKGENNLLVTGTGDMVYSQQLATIEGHGSDWYAECLGRVKSTSSSVVSGMANLTDEKSMELTDFSLPE